MPKVKIKYVGVKVDGERAFKADTEIEWFPGDEHEVDSKVAEQMLRHPDVFVQVAGEPLKAAPPPKLNAVAADQDEVDDEADKREQAAKKAKAEAEAAALAKKAEPEVPPARKREVKAPSNPPRKPAKKAAKKATKAKK